MFTFTKIEIKNLYMYNHEGKNMPIVPSTGVLQVSGIKQLFVESYLLLADDAVTETTPDGSLVPNSLTA